MKKLLSLLLALCLCFSLLPAAAFADEGDAAEPHEDSGIVDVQDGEDTNAPDVGENDDAGDLSDEDGNESELPGVAEGEEPSDPADAEGGADEPSEEEPAEVVTQEEEPGSVPGEEEEDEPLSDGEEDAKGAKNAPTRDGDRAVTASGTCGAQGDNLSWTLYEDGELVIEGSGMMADYEYQSSPWFSNKEIIRSVDFPDGLTSIGDRAFSGCIMLSEVTFPSGITDIGMYAFSDCNSLSSITIPDSVTTLGECVFSWCTGLTSVSIGEGLSTIMHRTFINCFSLSEVTIPGSVETIESQAFQSCDGLTTVIIENGVKNIGVEAFRDCDNLTCVFIPASITNIEKSAFLNCSSMTSYEVSDANSEYCSIDGILFSKDLELLVAYPCGNGQTSYVIPETVKIIGEGAFSGNETLLEITFPSNLTTICDEAFSGCSGLTELQIPGSINYLSGFNNCKELTNVTIENGVKEIGKEAFCSCEGLTSITIPDSVVSIGQFAFLGCYELETITFGNGLREIHFKAFGGCRGLYSIELPESVYMLDEAFIGCSNLASITIGDGITDARHPFDSTAWWNAQEDGLIYFDYLFLGFKNVCPENIVVRDGTRVVGGSAFYGHSIPESLVLPNSVEIIGSGAFGCCENLASVTFGSGLKTIGEFSFDDCSRLTEIYVPDGVTNICQYAFYGCSSLTSVSIPSSLINIESQAFERCTKLRNVNYSGTRAQRTELEGSSWTTNGNGPLFSAIWIYLGSERIVVAAGECGAQGDNLTWTLYEDGELVIEGEGAMAGFGVPDYDTDETTFAPWYSHRSTIHSVSLPAGLTKITGGAFAHCSAIGTITIPASVISIEDLAFYCCSGLEGIYVEPENGAYRSDNGVLYTADGSALLRYPSAAPTAAYAVAEGTEIIRFQAFAQAGNLHSITLPEGLQQIMGAAFADCTGITEIVLPSSVTKLWDSVFASCSNLDNVTFSGDMPEILGAAFENASFTSHYPAGNETWTQESLQQYGGNNIVWTPYTQRPVLSSGNCGAQGDNLTWTLYEDGELVIEGDGDMADYNSNGPWYAYREQIFSLTVCDGVTRIGGDAFFGCNQISEVSLPGSLRSIGRYAFGRTAISDVQLPEGLQTISAAAFYSTNLTEITFPASLVQADDYESGDGVFLDTPIQNIYVAEGSQSFRSEGGVLFSNDGKTLVLFPAGRSGSYTVPTGVETIGLKAFDGNHLSSLTLPEGVVSIEDSAFQFGRTPMTLFLPASLSNIENAFYSCNIQDVILAEGSAYFSVAGGALYTKDFSQIVLIFDDDSDVFVVAEGVETIDWGVFSDSVTFKEIVLPASLTSFYSYELQYIQSLTTITVSEQNEKYYSIDGVLFEKPSQTLLCYPNGRSETEYAIPSGTKAIGDSAFGDNWTLTTLEIPASVEAIADGSLYSCRNLSQILVSEQSAHFKVRDGVLFSKDGSRLVFCPGTKSGAYDVPAGVTEIAGCAFRSCYNLTEVTLPEGLTRIGWCAFEWCYDLREITLPISLSSIEYYAFYGCDALTRVNYPGSEEQWNAIEIRSNNDPLLNAEITWRPKPIITQQPEDAAVYVGESAVFTVAATDADSYQWFYLKPGSDSWTAVSVNGNAASYTLSAAAERHNGYKYCCTVTNSAGSRVSATATLTVKVPIVITAQPQNVTVNEGATATFTVAATGATGYQWYVLKPGETDWTAVSAASGKTASYSFTTALRHNGYRYRCELTNATETVVTDAAELTLRLMPVITKDPFDETVYEGTEVLFIVRADDAESYQWYYRTSPSGEWKAVAAAAGKTANYGFTTALRHNGYQYRCKVTNAVGSVYSGIARLSVAKKLTITTQPTDQHVNEGATATFAVVSTSTDSYQWYFMKPGETTWNPVSAAAGKTATYSFTTAARHNGYQYRCELSNDEESIFTDTVTLTLNLKPVITLQPANKGVYVDESATFTVVAEGAMSYQWSYLKPGASAWTNVSNNGTSASYTLPAAAERHNGYKYRCTVKNAVGSTVSAAATLTVKVPIVITTQPTIGLVNEGATATFKVTATGADSFLWYYQKPGETDWTSVSSSSGKTASYSMTTAARHDGYKYRCELKNATESVVTDAVTLTLNLKPVITQQPESLSIYAGYTASFTVVADGAAGYQWSYQKPGETTWTNVSSNGTSETYSLTAAARHNGYKYRCTVKNSVGSRVSATATLTVMTPIVITTQPVDKSVAAGKSVTFKVTATGASSYQWYYQKPGETTWTAVSASSGKKAAYTMTAAARHDGYKYRCLLKNATTSVYTDAVTLTVG